MRSYRPYAGVSVDLAIEQSLMATLKGNQGLTHGRGFNDLILSRPVVGKLTGVNLHTPEQSSAEFSMGTDVDPQLLFQRALNFASSGVVNTTLEECLRYELCPISMSLFDENGYMRTATKSTLATYLVESCLFEDFPLKTMKIVHDGGALLHRVGWTKTDTFDRIVHGYHRAIAISGKCSVTDADLYQLFLMGTLKVPQRVFVTIKGSLYHHFLLSSIWRKKFFVKSLYTYKNPSNKQAFVNALVKSLQDVGHEVFQSPDDEVGSGDTILVRASYPLLQI